MSVPSSARRPIERYVRCSVEIHANHGCDVVGSIELGSLVEHSSWLRSEMREALREIGRHAIAVVRPDGGEFTESQADQLTDVIERAMIDGGVEAWFVEVWSATEALTQVYAPCGMPRDR